MIMDAAIFASKGIHFDSSILRGFTMRSAYFAISLFMCLLACGAGLIRPETARAGLIEYQECMSKEIPATELTAFIYACSNVAGDTSSPNDIRAEAFLRRAIAYGMSNDNRAVDDITEAIRLAPTAELYIVRSILLSNKGRKREALADLDTAMNLPDQPRKAWWYLMCNLQPLKTYDPALARAKLPSGIMLTQIGKTVAIAPTLREAARSLRDELTKQ